MYSKLVNACTIKLIKNNIIKSEDRETCQYGLYLVVTTIVNIATALTIGLFLEMPIESLVVLFYYIALRAFAGGLHIHSDLQCYIISALIIVLNLSSARFILNNGAYHAVMIAGCVAATVIFYLSPVVHENRPLDYDQYPIFRRNARIIVVVLLTVTAILFFLKIYNIAITSSITIFFVGLSVLLGYLRQKLIS